MYYNFLCVVCNIVACMCIVCNIVACMCVICNIVTLYVRVYVVYSYLYVCSLGSTFAGLAFCVTRVSD